MAPDPKRKADASRKSVIRDIKKAVKQVGLRFFLLYSALQQFRMLQEIGFCSDSLQDALEILNSALRACPKIDYLMEDRENAPPEMPIWLTDLFDLCISDHGDAIRREWWNGYQDNPAAGYTFF